MHHNGNDSTSTDLYLVRIWKRRLGDGSLNLHGKLQHVVSGAACYFDALSNLPDALEKMLEQEAGMPGSEAGDPVDDGLGYEMDAHLDDQHKGG